MRVLGQSSTRKRASALLLAASGLLAVSCAGSGGTRRSPTVRASIGPPAAPNPPPAHASAATAPPPLPTPIQDPCRVAQALTDAAIARADAFARTVMEQQLASGAYTGAKPALPIDSFTLPTWLSCVKTPAGAWAIVLAKAQLTPRDDWSTEWVLDGDVALAHVDRHGVSTLAPIETEATAADAEGVFLNRELFPGALNCCAWVFGGLEPLELFDFDGDGEPEVHVGASYGHEGVHERWDMLFTFNDGRLERYAPAAAYSFEGMRDETGDGIPDLLMAEPLSGGESCGSGFPADGSGMSFIAHALPGGGFSNDDAAARAFARRGCPAAPAVIRDLNDVLCARLWGADPAKLELQVRARFRPWDCDAEMAGRHQKPRATAEYELMLSGATTRVPFTLP